AAHAGGVPYGFELHVRALARDHGRDHALAGGGCALDDAGDEVVVGRVAQRAELLDAGHMPAALDAAKHRLEHELVAEALLRLAGDRRDEASARDDVVEPPALLLGRA